MADTVISSVKIFLDENGHFEPGEQPYHQMDWSDVVDKAVKVEFVKHIVNMGEWIALYRVFYTIDYSELWATNQIVINH